MKAIVYPTVPSSGEAVTIVGDPFHHLANVLRVRTGDPLLLLSGAGTSTPCVIEAIAKKSLVVRAQSARPQPRVACCDVLIFYPKRDALESMLKAATEFGVNRIFLYRGKYSQEKFPDRERVDALVRSAMEQSNNPWMPEVSFCLSPQDWPRCEQTIIMDVATAAGPAADRTKTSLLVIGPEAGFAADERTLLRALPSPVELSFPTPILRASTALPAGLGWWFGKT